MASIIGLCNPLLDVSVTCDAALLAKYGLKSNDAILSGPEHATLIAELENNTDVSLRYSAGGAGQNTIRVAQWLMAKAGKTAFFGSVGKDSHADVLRKEASKHGMALHYYDEAEGVTTGTCACLCVGHDRSMVADLAAANHYNVNHLQRPENWNVCTDSDIVYVTSFMQTVSPPAVQALAAMCEEKNKTFCLNLSAPFLMQVPPFFAAFKEVAGKVNFLFGNDDEFGALAAALGIEGSLDFTKAEVYQKIADALPAPKNNNRHFVCTLGSNGVAVATVVDGKVNVEHVPANKLTAEQIVDSIGAGDAFVGGFLVGLYAKDSLANCAALGQNAACYVLGRVGCDLEGDAMAVVPEGKTKAVLKALRQ